MRGNRPWRDVSVIEMEGGRRTLPRAESAARRTPLIIEALCDPSNVEDRLTKSLRSSCFTSPTPCP